MSETTESAPEQEPAEPLFRVTRGTLDAEQLAALTVVLSAAAASGGETGEKRRRDRGWTNRSRMMPAWVGRSGWGNF